MHKKQYLLICLLSISILYLIYLSIGMYVERNFSYPESHGIKFIFLILTVANIVIILFLFCVDRYKASLKIALLSKNIHIVKILLMAILLILLFVLGGTILYDYYILSQNEKNSFSIGIYFSDATEPLYFSGENINNPVITHSDISDAQAVSVADPFLIYENNSFYLFFEIINSITYEGDIGLAESNDGYNWTYKQIILNESFHLSYPCVFKYNNQYYMIPETAATHSVKLYKADDFPYNWSFEKNLIDGKDFVDSTIFYYNNIWWLFTENRNNYSLYLYFADSPLDNWTEHPSNPIISKNANISRPGGNVIVDNNRIFRYTQDDYPSYGNQVWVFEIFTLTKQEYNETRIGDKPILKGNDNWNKFGMHHISVCQVNNIWIAAVDGKGYP